MLKGTAIRPRRGRAPGDRQGPVAKGQSLGRFVREAAFADAKSP